MAKFSARMQRTASAAASLGVVTVPATTGRRVKIYDLIVGSEATPADNAFLFVHQRITTTGTTSAVTPFPLDPADLASVASVGQNATIEPTYTANAVLLTIPLNQRATFRWVAAPGGELLIPQSGAVNGVGIQTPTAGGAVAITETIFFEEQ